jgi:probable DNA repair protein
MTLSNPDIPLQTLDVGSLFERLRAGHMLVTANSRLTRVLSGQYKQWRISHGDKLWQSPGMVSWDIWLLKLWEAASLQGIAGTDAAVPGGQQLLSLWESVLRDDSHAQQLLRPESLASQLRETRHLMVEWEIDPSHPAWFGDDNENHAAYRRWNRSFETLCRRNKWIPPENRTALICQAVRESRLRITQNIDLLGFDEFNPAQNGLLMALVESGTGVNRLAVTPAATGAVLWESTAKKDELQSMARWIRYWVENEPDSRIAVVVPDLQERRGEVERALEEILIPGGARDTHARPWNFSMGLPLARLPMVEAAFDLFSLLDRRIDIQHIGRVLRSPWIRGGISERKNRALLEKCLRDKYPRQLNLNEVRFRAREIRKYDRDHQELPESQQEPRGWNSPEMASALDTLQRFERDSCGVRHPSAWAESFDQLLASLGWPLTSDVERGQAGHEDDWQAFQAWQDALRELASLDATIAGLKRRAAVSQLRQICGDRIFQPRTPPANIQVLGLYEISGLRFDHLWVLGLDHGNWPPAARPNPFIPAALQREAGIPHSSPQRELAVARIVTNRLLETAGDSIFSYPGRAEGEPVLPSPLLKTLPLMDAGELPQWKGNDWRMAVSQAPGPRVAPLAMPGSLGGKTARGGSSILRHQALCPFRAFASNRLDAAGLETPVNGISAMLHGSLVHGVLEQFWKETRTQDALLQLDEESLAIRVIRRIDQVLDEERGLKFRPEFRKVEGDRLFRLVMNCLELDKIRHPFEVVGFEKQIMYVIEGQTIRLIIDRMDRLVSGDQVIIDYKTGKVDPKKWFSDRPEDPQLPLYAISAEETPAAVVFAVIRDDGCLFRGVVREDGIFPGLPPRQNSSNEYLVEAGRQLPSTIVNWRQILQRLMADFLDGEAAIDPKNGRKTCDNSYCDLHSLCRIGELEQMQKQYARGSGTEAAT